MTNEAMDRPASEPRPTDAPRGWDLEWEPLRRAGAPDRLPPSAEAAYAEFPVRAIAFAVDVLLLWLIFQLLLQGRALVALWLTRDAPQQNDPTLVVSGLVVVAAIALISLGAVYFWRVFRATPGQMVLGLFVIRRGTGERVTRGAALLRWLALYAPFVLLISYTQLIDIIFRSDLLPDGDPLFIASLAYFVPIAWYVVLGLSVLVEGKRGRGLHDRLAGSVVVRRAGPPA
jgi:uncharacterized RDD family membrane protein YckC